MGDSLQILEKVNAFYSGAFSQLVIYTSALVAFVGVIIPVVIQYIQNRSSRIERELLQNLIIQESDKSKQELKKWLIEHLNSEKDILEKNIMTKIGQVTDNYEKQMNISQANIYHLEGNSFYDAKEYGKALNGFVKAVPYYIKSKMEQGCQQMLTQISYCLRQLNESHFSDYADPDINSKLNDLINTLEKNNDDGRYVLILKDLKPNIASAKKRKATA